MHELLHNKLKELHHSHIEPLRGRAGEESDSGKDFPEFFPMTQFRAGGEVMPFPELKLLEAEPTGNAST